MLINFTGIFIIVCIALAFLYIGFKAFGNKSIARSGGWSWRIVVVVLVILALRLFTPLRAQHPLTGSFTLTPPTSIIGLIADIFTLAGLLVTVWARRTLGRNWSPMVVVKEKHELVEAGPYRYVRHPMYSGFILLFLGPVVWINSLYGYAFLAVVLIGMRIKSLNEERLLTEQFPDAYPEYKQRTKALIPFVW